MAERRYTLIIPTYNRPADLARLLRHLAYQKADFQILVLDSSADDNHRGNVEACKGIALDLRLERFDPEIDPFEKFWRGAELVQTEYASLCADDDLLIVPSIERIIAFLDRNRDYGVAHGWYFQFYLERTLGLTSVLYRSPSIDSDDYLERLYQLFSRYEAITYGVHRTSVLRRVLLHVQSMRTTLARELLGSALAVVAGKVARLPVLYSGRSLGPSGAYRNWHPIEFLTNSPRGLFEEYARYKAKLLEYSAEAGIRVDDAAGRFLDLAHMRYISEYFRPEVIDYVYREARNGRTSADLMSGVWAILSNRQGLVGALYRSSVLRELRSALLPGLREHHVEKIVSRSSYTTVDGVTATGKPRAVEIYERLRSAVEAEAIQPSIAALVTIMAGYE